MYSISSVFWKIIFHGKLSVNDGSFLQLFPRINQSATMLSIVVAQTKIFTITEIFPNTSNADNLTSIEDSSRETCTEK